LSLGPGKRDERSMRLYHSPPVQEPQHPHVCKAQEGLRGSAFAPEVCSLRPPAASWHPAGGPAKHRAVQDAGHSGLVSRHSHSGSRSRSGLGTGPDGKTKRRTHAGGRTHGGRTHSCLPPCTPMAVPTQAKCAAPSTGASVPGKPRHRKSEKPLLTGQQHLALGAHHHGSARGAGHTAQHKGGAVQGLTSRCSRCSASHPAMPAAGDTWPEPRLPPCCCALPRKPGEISLRPATDTCAPQPQVIPRHGHAPHSRCELRARIARGQASLESKVFPRKHKFQK